jgi:cardiolipin synthase C
MSETPKNSNRERRHTPLAVAGLLLAVILSGCASLPTDYPSPRSEAMTDTADTRIGRDIAPLLAEHPDRSGFYTLSNGLDAFVARLALAGAAEKSLDVQYYLFHDDVTGRLLAGYLLQAADRGVRVRLLLDDMDMAGRDAGLAAISRHPNIEIRLFNPFPSRTLRYLDFVTHFGVVSRRMHNKSFTVDNQATIVGGRNIGDEYFAAASGANFGDMDVMAIGPVVHEVSQAFDRYWDSELALPVEALGAEEDLELLDRARDRLAQEIRTLPGTDYGRRLLESDLVGRLDRGELDLYWGEARLLSDLPEKIRAEPDDRTTHLGPELGELLAAVQKDLILVSPYFVPGREGTDLLRSLVERGRRVTVLTNSLAATDVPAVHAGYARYRRALVEAGVEIYEMRPTRQAGEAGQRRLGDSQASLHAKTFVFDGESVLVGSMNFDPRSNLLNTEMGILIESAELAGAISAWRDQALADIAWRVTAENVETSGAPAGEEMRLVWTTRENGHQLQHHGREPEARIWPRVQALLLRLLPIERQL